MKGNGMQGDFDGQNYPFQKISIQMNQGAKAKTTKFQNHPIYHCPKEDWVCQRRMVL